MILLPSFLFVSQIRYFFPLNIPISNSSLEMKVSLHPSTFFNKIKKTILVLTLPYDSVCNLSKSCPWQQCRQVSWSHCLHDWIILLLANESERDLIILWELFCFYSGKNKKLLFLLFCWQLHEKSRSVDNNKKCGVYMI